MEIIIRSSRFWVVTWRQTGRTNIETSVETHNHDL